MPTYNILTIYSTVNYLTIKDEIKELKELYNKLKGLINGYM